jgi:hypothetical protein
MLPTGTSRPKQIAPPIISEPIAISPWNNPDHQEAMYAIEASPNFVLTEPQPLL